MFDSFWIQANPLLTPLPNSPLYIKKKKTKQKKKKKSKKKKKKKKTGGIMRARNYGESHVMTILGRFVQRKMQ